MERPLNLAQNMLYQGKKYKQLIIKRGIENYETSVFCNRKKP